MKKVFILSAIAALSLAPPAVYAQSKKKKDKNAVAVAPMPEKKPESAIKDYSKVITKDAISDTGLFTVHKVDKKYFFEIPNTLLNKDMLLVSRLSKLPANLGGGYVNAGSETNEQLIVWQRFQDKILIKIKSFNAVANDSLPISISVKANNYEPTLFAFDIVAFSNDSANTVIDVSKFYGTDVKSISGLSADMRETYKVRGLDESRSFINTMKSFPMNIEVVQDFSYNAAKPPVQGDAETISIHLNQ